MTEHPPQPHSPPGHPEREPQLTVRAVVAVSSGFIAGESLVGVLLAVLVVLGFMR